MCPMGHCPQVLLTPAAQDGMTQERSSLCLAPEAKVMTPGVETPGSPSSLRTPSGNEHAAGEGREGVMASPHTRGDAPQ